MTSDSALPPVIGAIADDRDGNALGTITTVFLDDVTQRPTWVGLTDGPEATSGDVPVIAPISDAEYAEGRLRLTVPADAVRTAPRVAQPDRLSPEEETSLREHYRAAAVTGRHATTDTVAIPTVPTGTATDTATDTGTRTAGTPAGTAVGTAADAAVTRSEEQLQVRTVVEPWTRAVLRIEEVTEEVMVPVTITRQQARIDYLPLSPTDRAAATGTADNAGAPGAERSTSTGEWVTLYAEQPTVTLERVPVERVRLQTSWASEETTVTQELRREQVELTTTETPLG